MSLTWGAIIGTTTIIPYFYSVFFITVLLHRCTRDFERYAIKLMKNHLSGLIFAYSGAQSSMGKIGNVTVKSSSTSIFPESTKVRAQKYLDI